jgi:hypothetical protein
MFGLLGGLFRWPGFSAALQYKRTTVQAPAAPSIDGILCAEQRERENRHLQPTRNTSRKTFAAAVFSLLKFIDQYLPGKNNNGIICIFSLKKNFASPCAVVCLLRHTSISGIHFWAVKILLFEHRAEKEKAGIYRLQKTDWYNRTN